MVRDTGTSHPWGREQDKVEKGSVSDHAPRRARNALVVTVCASGYSGAATSADSISLVTSQIDRSTPIVTDQGVAECTPSVSFQLANPAFR
jgi:hypothetical protein